MHCAHLIPGVFTVLLGGAIPRSLHGTKDETYYNHYSTISSVSLNWGLPSLGRWDCGANVLGPVARKTGYKNGAVDVSGFFFNASFPGPMNSKLKTPGWWPSPNTKARCASGLGVLQSVSKTWGDTAGTYNYTNVYPYDTVSKINADGRPVVGTNDANVTNSGSGSPPLGASGNSGSTLCPSLTLVMGGLGFLVLSFL